MSFLNLYLICISTRFIVFFRVRKSAPDFNFDLLEVNASKEGSSSISRLLASCISCDRFCLSKNIAITIELFQVQSCLAASLAKARYRPSKSLLLSTIYRKLLAVVQEMDLRQWKFEFPLLGFVQYFQGITQFLSKLCQLFRGC